MLQHSKPSLNKILPEKVRTPFIKFLRSNKIQEGNIATTISNQQDIPKEKADCVVIGAGVVGIAVARQLALAGRDVLVLDSAPTFGTSTTSRNSQVIHAGIYYPPNSLKSVLCVRGRELMYKYCFDNGIPHRQTGKLIVATSPSEIPKLFDFMNRGTENGVPGLKMFEGSEAMELEPELQCVKALLSPVSGIVDSHSLMLSLVGEAESFGTTISYNSTVIGGHLEGNCMHLHVTETKNLENWDGSCPPCADLVVVPKFVVNSAGLSAVALARRFDGLSNCILPPAFFARGCYFTLANTKTPPFNRLIYPIPEDGGIGVHVTLDLDGQIKFGPDVEWINGVDDISSFLDRYDYSVDSSRADRFYQVIRKYYPNLKNGSLEPGYAGIRPKICGSGQSPMDFIVQGEDIHGVPGLVNLFGIESPGLTSSLAIAEYLVSREVT